jgi:hypothetical protein
MQTIDLTPTITPKSDQLNADDLIGEPITIKVTGLKGTNEPTQPIAISYQGDNGKPYKPCKSMRRILVSCWGANGAEYVGRSMTLYRDNEVAFGGIKVGGIRISHLSHIEGPLTLALTVTRASRKPYTVQPLAVAKLPDLTPEHKHWSACKQGIADGKTTVADLRKKYEISQENERLLTDKND